MLAGNPSSFVLFLVVYQLHWELDWLEGFEVVPVAFFLVVDPLACGLYYGRDVLLAVLDLLWLRKANFFLDLWRFGLYFLTFAILCLHFRLDGFYFLAGDGFNGDQSHPQFIFLLTGNRIITPSLLFLRLSLDKLQELFPLPDEVSILEAVNSMIFEFGEIVHVELNILCRTCRMKDW